MLLCVCQRLSWFYPTLKEESAMLETAFPGSGSKIAYLLTKGLIGVMFPISQDACLII